MIIGSPEEERTWLQAFQSRPFISGCEANRGIIDDQLTSMLLPLTVENLVGIMDAQFAIARLASAAPGSAPTLRVQPVEAPAEPEEPAPINFRAMTIAQLRAYLKNNNQNRKNLPETYTRDVLRNLTQTQYERLALEYSSQQLRDRSSSKS
jgi:hypothetical protein